MFDDDSSDSSSDDDSVEDSVDDPKNDAGIKCSVNEDHKPSNADADADVENLDELIKEYKVQDETQEENIATIDDEQSSFYYGVIMSGIEVRDLDIDFVMRTSLLGESTES